MTTPPSPEELAQAHGKPLQRALIDLDLRDPSRQVIGADPADLSGFDMEPVKSIMAPWAVITVMAHRGEGQTVADLLEARPGLSGMVSDYGESYAKEGVMDFAFHAISEEQIRNVERGTGRRLPDRPGGAGG